uniref:Cadherin 24 n=1 Tax=Stegastes partitus TaxID=144197 RepID=A0A3B4ZV26_9TELE
IWQIGLVFEEAESEVEEDVRERMEGKGPRSRSRRSWIWNQFFVIEEYAGPEPVLIGRLHTDMDRNDGRTKYVLRGEGAGSVFVIDEKTGNIHVTKPLDREEKDEYRLIATATDRQTDRALEPSSQFIIRVLVTCPGCLLALSLSLRRQKRDSLSPLEEDDVRENIITYDDEGGGEADTAAFDIAALQSAPHSSRSASRSGLSPKRTSSRAPGPGGPSLALRVGEFLRLRLAQVTFDPSQPPYDSVQVYGLEGTGSRAGSLSSLESEGEKDAEKEDWGAGLEEWGPQFQKLKKPPPPVDTILLSLFVPK